MLDSRRWLVPLAALVLFAVLPAPAQQSKNGYIDTAFNPSCVNMPNVNFTTRSLLVLGDGKILAGGNYSAALGACRNGIVRLRTNGVTDTAFISPLPANNFVSGLALQSSGKIIISGGLSDSTGATFPAARLGVNGTMDPNFAHLQDPGLVGHAVLVQPDDKVIVGGAASGAAGFLARLNSNGTVDNTFAGGTAVTDIGSSTLGINALALQSGKVLVGGSFTFYFDGTVQSNRSGLARLNEDGSLDKTFRAPLTNADVRAILVQQDGKILVAGSFTTHHGAGQCLERLNANGTRDSAFTPDAVNVTALSLALEPDGKILVGHALGIMRVNTNGVLDASFGPRNADGFLGTKANFASAVARSIEGNILVGAVNVTVGSTERRGLIRLFGNLPPAPVILSQSTNTAVDAGTNVTFSIIATGAPPLSFQWRKDNKAVSGATSSNLTLLDVDSTAEANYTVIVSNPGGAVTSSVIRLDVNFFVSPISITVQPAGSGSVSPNFANRALEIGRTYTLTAKPVKGFLFTNWSGFETSANPVLNFVMQSNEVLVANFVPSPFIPVRGPYHGLFFDTNAPAHENAGGFLLTLDDVGGFKGTVTMGKSKRKFSGKFSLDRVATVNIPATTKLPALALALELDTQNGFIGGGVSIGTNAPSTLAAIRNGFSAKLAPAPNAGLFNTALPSTNDPALAPVGDGYVPLVVAISGRVSGKGFLADGTPWSVVSATSADGWVPVYVSLYSGAGSIFGWLSVTNTGANDVAGALWWKKPAGVRGAIQPAGITNRMDTLGSRFLRVTNGTPVLNLPDDVAIFYGGNLADSITNPISLGGDNKIIGANALALTLSPTKGTMTGSFTDPATLKKRAVKGVVLPNQNQARGFFPGVNAGGGVFVGSE